MAGQRVLLIRGLMDYLPGISPMSYLQARLTSEGFDVTMITHLIDGYYKNAYWDAVIGHSQGAIDALRDAPELARYNPQLAIVTIDPPRTSTLFRCVPGARYLNLHTRFTPPAQLIGAGGVERRVAPTRQPVAREFARDRRLRPADRFGNRADRMAHSLGQTNLFSFRIRQMRIA
jgi:hypothetical protein